jgi:hypothetical protein
MQVLEHWDPLSLPRGSIRAIIAFALLGLLSYFLLNDVEAPLSLAFVSLLVLGHYFGARAGRSEYQGRPPLFLPRGSIRILIIALILAMAWFMWEDDRLPLDAKNRETVVVLVALGLIAGYVIRATLDFVTGGRMAKPRRLFENVKAILALMATAGLIIACMNSDLEQSENIALLVTPFIAFYFGSRQGWQDARPAMKVVAPPPASPAPRAPEPPTAASPAPPPEEPPTVKSEPSASSEV